MQRYATFIAIVSVAAGAAVAVSGTFAPGGGSGGGLDRVSAGILAGAFAGAAVALLSHALVATALKLDTEAAFKALIVGFGAKCLGAILPWAAMSFLPQVGRLADPTAYVITFAVVVLIVLGGGVLDHLRAISDGSVRNSPDVPDSPAAPLDKSPTEFAGQTSDRGSGSAFSLPRNPAEDSPETSMDATRRSADSSSVPRPIFSSGSSASLESAP